MSVKLLLSDVASKPAAHLAQVSSTLFYELDMDGELAVQPVAVDVPSDPQYKKVIDDLIRAMGFNPSDPATFWVHVLKRYPHVAVQLGSLNGLQLLANGPGSYKLT